MAVSERVDAVETADGRHKFFYPQGSDIKPNDSEFPNAIRPDRLKTIIELRNDHKKARDLNANVFTDAELDAIYDPHIPLTAAEAKHRLELQEDLSEHPFRTTLRDPSLMPLSGFGRFLRSIAALSPL